MLLTSSFVLNRFRSHSTLNSRSLMKKVNRTESLNQHVLHPYIHSFSNIPEASALLHEITIPDVLPSDLPAGSKFSMVAGIGRIVLCCVGS
jgi:carnosine N-methyltransferase